MARNDPAPLRASLTSLNGELAGQRFVLTMDQYIGLQHCSDSEIAFPNIKLGVSRRHLRVHFIDGAFVMMDSDSMNGSFCNGERVQSRRVLAHGDVIAAGQAEFRFEIG
ncbi:MAG TPA: FHA domain-containing protein [Kofleriaceae bacterium]|jgi:predicted component of type VI protein secretion system|nr:FHA domain-containing protein [Kofleriaceae bacterium]